MLAVGPEDLGEKVGKSIKCPHCGEEHPIKYGTQEMPDGTWRETKMLAFYTCGEKSYLAGIDGQLLKPRNK